MNADLETDLIQSLLRPIATSDAALGLTDDCALLGQSAGQSLSLTKDALVEGIHFLPDDPPETVAHKALAVNLSDLAAMGSRPVGILMALMLPQTHRGTWLARFAHGLQQSAQQFKTPLLGGDITQTPGPFSVTVTALGEVRNGAALTRSAARVGDVIAVSGPIGDGALGLLARLGHLTDCDDGYLTRAYQCPAPQLALGMRLAGTGAAAMDISDGLLGDLTRLCKASKVGARITLSDIPLSPAVSKLVEETPSLLEVAITGGDDYQLLVVAPPSKLQPFLTEGSLLRIGNTTTDAGEVTVIDRNGKSWHPENGKTGYSHL